MQLVTFAKISIISQEAISNSLLIGSIFRVLMTFKSSILMLHGWQMTQSSQQWEHGDGSNATSLAGGKLLTPLSILWCQIALLKTGGKTTAIESSETFSSPLIFQSPPHVTASNTWLQEMFNWLLRNITPTSTQLLIMIIQSKWFTCNAQIARWHKIWKLKIRLPNQVLLIVNWS